MMKLFITTLILANSLFAFTIASVAGYKKPVSEIVALYEKKSGQKVDIIFGNQAQIITSIKQSDSVIAVFGDKSSLEKTDLKLLHSKILGHGRLVLASSKDKKVTKIEDLQHDDFKKIAFPDPNKAIYGIATKQALEKLNLYQKLESKLMPLSTVPQVSTYLMTNEVDAGFINLTNALSIKDKIGGYIEIDDKLYNKIEISVFALKNTKELKEFFEFLDSQEVKEISKRYGL